VTWARYTSDPLCGVPIQVTDYSKLTYDPVRHQLLMFGGGHSSTPRTDVDVFSFPTLTWSSAYPPTPTSELVFSNYDPSLARWISTGRASLLVNSASLPELAGQSGSITVSHAGGYGALAGKAVSLEPATGYSFDTPLVSRPR
jgi:hypothetical protein